MRSLSAVFAGVLLTAGIAGCSDATTTPQPESIETATFAPALGVDLAASTKTAQGVYLRDITEGTGPAISATDSVAVRYTGYLKDGTVFDSNEQAGSPLLERRLGTQQLLAAFEAGLVGMKVAGVRQIIIPPALGYPSGPLAGRIMVFRVTMAARK